MTDSRLRPRNRFTMDDNTLLLYDFIDAFYVTASLQGKIAYLLMSVHVVNPGIFISWNLRKVNIFSVLQYNPHTLLFRNMVYGMAVHIFSRPSMFSLIFTTRLSFSILGSMMFSYSSLQVFEWLIGKMGDNHINLLTLLGFLAGRLMMGSLVAYLYHVDSRNVFAYRYVRRDNVLESMYTTF
ncbi:uncharacterized protein LOC108735754 [Agrilus planipennis]|uniref:Uncharacterized protein LOC108735754 n=1 Tax=Agrilus planipennis TaxID=224129 RepID=A0A1W4WTC8_AGRPL|nr:uncharacterized protein LOC108735754 [Agrilus planipennis]